jgi:hypothetical protein
LAQKIQVVKIPVTGCNQGRSTHTPQKKGKKKKEKKVIFFVFWK